jgi:ABC-2 type transport system ATP-binding protein
MQPSEQLADIRAYVTNGDINLALRLMMDFALDADFPKDILKEIRILRMENNLQSELSEQQSFKKKIYNLLTQIELMLAERPTSTTFDDMQKSYLDGGEAVLYQPSEERKKGITVFRGENLKKTYKGFPFSLKNVNLELKTGEITSIVGENGNGKTTLLRIVAGELLADSGSQLYPNLGVSPGDWYKIKQKIAFIPQNLEKWSGKLIENLYFAAAVHGINPSDNEDTVEFIIHRLGLSKYKNATWNEISSGYKLRFALAKAMVWRPKILILDEPLANLDVNAKLLFMQDLRLLSQSTRFPVSILLSSQQLHEVETVTDKIMFIKNGVCEYYGATSDFGANRQTNVFEIGGNFGISDLRPLLQSLSDKVRIESTGQSFIVETPLEITGNLLLEKLIGNIKVDYFRDISQSTRKLFHQNA